MELEKSKFLVTPSKLNEELKSNFDLLKLELIKKFEKLQVLSKKDFNDSLNNLKNLKQ